MVPFNVKISSGSSPISPFSQCLEASADMHLIRVDVILLDCGKEPRRYERSTPIALYLLPQHINAVFYGLLQRMYTSCLNATYQDV